MRIFSALAAVTMAAVMVLTACNYEDPIPVITINSQPTAPSTLTEGSIPSGTNLTVSATVTEGASLTYQWFGNTSADTTDGTAIVGATGSIYSLPTDLTAGTYYYFCEVSAQRAAPVRTAPVTVTVNTKPVPVITIITQPTAPADLIEGEIPTNAHLTMVANATEGATLSYQWYTYDKENNQVFEAISGATNANYILPTDLQAGEHWYVCEVSAPEAESKRTDPVPVTVEIDIDYGQVVASGRDGTLTWRLTDRYVLIISGKGAMTNHIHLTAPWSAYRDYIQTVVIRSGVTSIGNWAFPECRSLTDVALPDSVTSIGDEAFSNCSSLTSIAIPNSVWYIGRAALLGCRSLTSITIPNGVSSIGIGAFALCDNLTSVTIPNSVTSIKGQSGSVGVFEDCYSLASIIVPNSVTSIGERAFRGCTSLTSITIPDNVTSIGMGALKHCTNLTSVTVGSSVTNIGNEAFEGCSSLTNIIIPGSVTSIGEKAFYDCSKLTNITIMATMPPTLLGSNFTIDGDTLHVPQGCVYVYNANPLWGAVFTNIVERQ